MADVLLVSKPLCPPWNDSGRNLPAALAMHGERHRYHVMTEAGVALAGPRLAAEPIYRAGTGRVLTVGDKLRPFRRLLRRDGIPLAHFFFTPNALSSRMARWALWWRPRRSVQTVTSLPLDTARLDRWLFGDTVVALSEWSAARCRAAGAANVRRIYPGVAPLPAADAARAAEFRRQQGLRPEDWVVLFAGDWEFGGAVETLAAVIVRTCGRLPTARFVIACRPKTSAASAAQARFETRLEQAGVRNRARLVGEVADMPALLAACDAHAFPVQSLEAKMDLPLVLIETMLAGKPVVVSDPGALPELLPGEPDCVVPAADAEAWAARLVQLAEAPGATRALAERQTARARDLFSPRGMAAAYETIYDELLSGSRS